MRGSNWHLTGRSALITGAAGGIGAAVARSLSARQMRLSLVDVRGDALQQLALDLGEGVMCQEVDITQREELDAAVAATLARFGRLDVVVVNAGVVTVGSVLLVRGIEHRSRTVAMPATRLALACPNAFQLVMEGLARRHRWAVAIRELERANRGRDTSPATSTREDTGAVR